MSVQEIGSTIAQFLIETQAVKFNFEEPFTWSSGWRSPVYCDNRKLLALPSARDFVAESLANIVRNTKGVNLVAGVATAGIPHATLVADRLHLPLVYVRPDPKAHGLKKQIEGTIQEDSKVALIEDLVSTGESSIRAAHVLQNAGCEISLVASIFSYDFPQSRTLFFKNGIKLLFLCNLEMLMTEALKNNMLDQNALRELARWRSNPDTWFDSQRN